MCQGLCDLEYINYVINSSASFSDNKKPKIVAKQFFSEKFSESTPFIRKKLGKEEQKEFKRTLESEATWYLNKEVLAIYYMQCEKKTDNKNAIYNKYKELKCNKFLNKILKVVSFNINIIY